MLNSNTLGIQDLASQIAKWNQPQSIQSLDGIYQKWTDDTCQKDVGIYSLDDIASKPSCNAGIDGIEDIVGVNGYFEPQGTSFCGLLSTRILLKNDLFLISRHDDDVTSRKVTYQQLSGTIAKDVLNALGIKSMAFEMKSRYAVSSHNHNEIYSRLSIVANNKYIDGQSRELSMLGRINVSTDYIDGDQDKIYQRIDLNPSNAQMSTILSNIVMPKIIIPYPPKPMIGTLRFVGIQNLSALISSNNLTLMDDKINVDPYDGRGKIRSDFDGWVFPNGIEIKNIDGQLSDASLVYTGSEYADFCLPDITDEHFLKMNPSLRKTASTDMHDKYYGMMESYQHNTSLMAHSHNTPDITLSGNPRVLCVLIPYTTGETIDDEKVNGVDLSSIAPDCGYTGFCQNFGGTADTFTQVTAYVELQQINVGTITTGINSNTDSYTESYPPYRILPVMMYIGGETREYYENLYNKYNQMK